MLNSDVKIGQKKMIMKKVKLSSIAAKSQEASDYPIGLNSNNLVKFNEMSIRKGIWMNGTTLGKATIKSQYSAGKRHKFFYNIYVTNHNSLKKPNQIMVVGDFGTVDNTLIQVSYRTSDDTQTPVISHFGNELTIELSGLNPACILWVESFRAYSSYELTDFSLSKE